MSAELFANAAMHGPPDGQVLGGYVLWQHGARIVVCDGGGATMPRLRDSTGLDEGGRGLHVVDALSAPWGSFRAAGAQVVWCDLGQPLDAAAGEAWAWLTAVLAEFPLAVDPDEHLIAAPKAARRSARGTCRGFPAEPSPPRPSAAGDRSSLIEYTARSADQQPGLGSAWDWRFVMLSADRTCCVRFRRRQDPA